MQLQAAPFFFIIRIDRQKQRETREFEGQLAVSQNYVFMQHETQSGEIVSVGKLAQELFPESKAGDTLIFHHFVTGKGIEDDEASPYLIHFDEIHNYYNVTVKSYNGERNLTYGVWDGIKITPHKDFIFLEVEEIKKEVIKTDTLIELKNWTESRDKKGDRMKEIKNTIVELTKSAANEDLKSEIQKRERIMNNISKEVNKKQIQVYKVAYFKDKIKEAGILNIACTTKISFMGREYIVAPSKYIYFAVA